MKINLACGIAKVCANYVEKYMKTVDFSGYMVYHKFCNIK